MEVWVAVVTHRHGNNVYASRTRKGIMDQLFDYVVLEWNSEIPDEGLPDILEKNISKSEVVDRYFELVGNEYLDTCAQITLGD